MTALGLVAVALFAAMAVTPNVASAQATEPEWVEAKPITKERDWYPCPKKARQSERYYPWPAQRDGIEGVTIVQCRFYKTGAARECAWVEERPEGSDFGNYSQRIGCLFKMKPRHEVAVEDEAKVVIFPITFKLPK